MTDAVISLASGSPALAVAKKEKPRPTVRARKLNAGPILQITSPPVDDDAVEAPEDPPPVLLSRTPRVPISDSIQPDGIVCLIDGAKRKMLHRHLRTKYGLSPEAYREHFGLPVDYPMTAPGYAREKSDYAKQQGLGTRRNARIRA